MDLIPPSSLTATSRPAEPAPSVVAASAPPIAASASPAAASAAPPSPAVSADDRSTAFRAVEGGNQLQSGEKLLVEAYAAIWVILFALVLFSWRRQRRLDDRMASLEGAIEKARRESDRAAAAEGGE
jgi:CcmD family protein